MNCVTLHDITLKMVMVYGILLAHYGGVLANNAVIRAPRDGFTNQLPGYSCIQCNKDILSNCICSLKYSVNSNIDILISEIDSLVSCCQGVSSRLDGIESIVEHVDSGIDGVESAIVSLASCCQGVSSRLDGIESIVEHVDSGIDGVESAIVSLASCCQGVSSRLDGIESIVEHVDSGVEVLLSRVGCTAIPITEPTTITESGYYCLANSITVPTNGFGIIVNADDVVLDLNNNLIDGVLTGSCGIVISGDRVEVKDGTILDCLVSGISTAGVSDLALRNIFVEGSSNSCRNGIFITTCTGVTVTDCTVVGCGVDENGGGYLIGASRDVICTDCIARNNVYGFLLGYTVLSIGSLEQSVFLRCCAFDNAKDGFFLLDFNDYVIQISVFSPNDQFGGTYNQFTDCIAEGNGNYGFACFSDLLTLTNCIAQNNDSSGMNLYGIATVVQGGSSSNNGRAGIVFTGVYTFLVGGGSIESAVYYFREVGSYIIAEDVVLANNGGSGIGIDGSAPDEFFPSPLILTGSLVKNCAVSFNGSGVAPSEAFGIYLGQYTSKCTIFGCSLIYNVGVGATSVAGSVDNVIVNTYAKNNGGGNYSGFSPTLITNTPNLTTSYWANLDL